MKLFEKYRTDLLLLLGLSAVYFLIRLPGLLTLPIFTDEAIYMRWVQIASQDPNWRFISLTDGKQPLYIWFSVIMMRLVGDPLLAGRLVSVVAGFLTLLGLYILSFALFKKRSIAAITVILYIFYPMAHVHDRLALYDSLVTTFYVWAAYVSVLLVKHVRLDLAYTLGFVIGAATLNKTSGFLSAYLLPFSLILFDFKQKGWKEKLIRWGMYALLAYVISQVFYSVLRLSPYFHIISEKNSTFFYPLSEWVTHAENFLRVPDGIFYGNLRGLTTWLIEYMTVPLAFVIAAFIKYREFFREKALLFLYFLAPFGAFALVGKVLFPRYIFFMSVMLLPLAACGIVWLTELIQKKYKVKERTALIGLTVLAVLYPAYVCIAYTMNPVAAPLPKADSRQYVNGWTSGWGVREAVEFFSDEAAEQEIFVGTQGTFGLMPFSLEMYLVDNENITLKGFWPIETTPPAELMSASLQMPTYVVFYQPCTNCGVQNEAPETWPLQEVMRIRQGNAESYFIIYKVNAPFAKK